MQIVTILQKKGVSTMNKTLIERITALETEYNLLIRSNTSTLKEMQRIDQIEQSIPYVRAWKWELVREMLIEPERTATDCKIEGIDTSKLAQLDLLGTTKFDNAIFSSDRPSQNRE